MLPGIAEEDRPMEVYTAMRHFADSWGLLAMTLFFLGVILFTLRPAAKTSANEAAQIPLKED
jgi:cytochrome c oxidase cbb3-type subunit 4